MSLFGFLGCGNMGGALASALAKSIESNRILLCDANKDKACELSERLGANVADAKSIAEKCDFIFIGVKPQGFGELFSEISPILKNRSDKFVLISMAAGISISAVEKYAGCNASVIRIMPNTPVSVGEGVVLFAANDSVSSQQLAEFKSAMAFSGMLDEIVEEKIDAASALSGCGPAFVYMFAEALADGAVECGLPRDKAMIYASQMILGSAKLLLESGKHPGQLKDSVCSPGGTTIAGVHALEDGSFRASAMNAVKQAYMRTLELKK